MATTTITYPNTLTNGSVADADQVMADFNAIKTAAETTKWGTGNLQAPNAVFPITFTVDAIAASQAIELRTVVPVAVEFVSAVINMDGLTNSGVLGFGVIIVGTGTALSTITASAVDTPTVASAGSFTIASAPSGAELILEVSERTGGTATLSDVSVTLWCKAAHQA